MKFSSYLKYGFMITWPLGNLAINVKGYLFYCWFRNAYLYKSRGIFSSLSLLFLFKLAESMVKG